jgi:hypothetical protein
MTICIPLDYLDKHKKVIIDNMRIRKTKILMSRKMVIIVSTIILSIAILFIGLEATGVTHVFNQSKANNTGTNINSVDYGGATDEQKSAGEQIKAESTDPTNTKNTNNSSDKKTMSVVITDASQYNNIVEVRSYANEIGANSYCIVQFQKGDVIITKKTDTLTNAVNSSCKTVDVPTSEFTSDGVWVVKITYTSDTATGKSDSINIDIKR